MQLFRETVTESGRTKFTKDFENEASKIHWDFIGLAEVR